MRLIIAPHVDDEVIGCGGWMDAETIVFYCGVDQFHGVSYHDRFKEALAVRDITNHSFYWPAPKQETLQDALAHLAEYPVYPAPQPEPSDLDEGVYGYIGERSVNDYRRDFRQLVADFEWVIQREKPDEVLLPFPSYNQDHQTVYEAAMVALRPHDVNHFVHRVLLYEEPDCFQPGLQQFRPQVYREIDIDLKLSLYVTMASQVRAHRSPDHLKALAAVRGAVMGVPAAEAFEVVRWAERIP